jgi:hypothetical protein
VTVARARWTAPVLYLTLALVLAFVASALAGLWDDAPRETGLRALGPGDEPAGSLRIEVLNGAGTPGLARDAMHHLRDRGFDVVFYGNASRFDHGRSVVLDRTGETDQARTVARVLGIDSVATAVDSSLLLEVTVVLGDDWPPVVVPERGWRDRLREAIQGDSAAATPDSAEGGGG